MFLVKLPQNRHPERSASPIPSRATALVARSQYLGGAYFTHAVRSFSTIEARKHYLLRYALDGLGYM